MALAATRPRAKAPRIASENLGTTQGRRTIGFRTPFERGQFLDRLGRLVIPTLDGERLARGQAGDETLHPDIAERKFS